MRISVFIATSVDGYIARENGDLDWLPADGGVTDAIDNGYAEFIATVDVCVMGRHTFEKVLTLGPWPFAGKRVVVLTSQSNGLHAPAGAEVEFVAGSPEKIVEMLRVQGAQHLYVDGGITIQRFLQAGLIDGLVINRIPILLGGGIPLFGRIDHDVPLRHVRTRQLENGFVQSEYEVVGADRP